MAELTIRLHIPYEILFTKKVLRTAAPVLVGLGLFYSFSPQAISQAESRFFSNDAAAEHYEAIEKTLLTEEEAVLSQLGLKGPTTHQSAQALPKVAPPSNSPSANVVTNIMGEGTSDWTVKAQLSTDEQIVLTEEVPAASGPEPIVPTGTILNGSTKLAPVAPQFLASQTVVPSRIRSTQSSDLNIPSPSVFFSLESQEAELEKLAREFEELDDKSYSLETQIDTAQEALLEVRTDKLLASLKAKDLAQQNSQLDAEELAYQERLEHGEYLLDKPGPIIVQPLAQEEALSPAQENYRFRQGSGVELPRRPTRKVLNSTLDFGGKSINDNMPVAQLTAVAVPFRSGPAPSFPPVFRAVQGDTVAIERRHNNWFRVVHQSGVRGWVNEYDLLFGPDSRTVPVPGRIVRIKPYNAASDKTDFEAAS